MHVSNKVSNHHFSFEISFSVLGCKLNQHIWFCVYREIGQKSSEELSREGSGVKAFAAFVSELGAQVPELMIPNISVLITHLEGEVKYTLSLLAL